MAALRAVRYAQAKLGEDAEDALYGASRERGPEDLYYLV